MVAFGAWVGEERYLVGVVILVPGHKQFCT
jgi:hypothetical protein